MALGSSSLALLFEVRANADQARREVASLRGDVQQSTSAISTAFAGVGSAVGIAGAAFAVTAGVALTAGKAIYDLAAASSEAGSKIFDASQKVSLSSETLSTLKFYADQSGSSLEDVTSAVIQMERRLSSAAGGNKELAKTFQSLGVDIKQGLTDPEAALSQLVKKFSELPDGSQKAALAMQVFGKSGANLLPTLEALGGDLDAAKERAAELGVVFSEEAARRADEFGDSVDTLKAQLGGLSLVLASDVQPAFTRVFTALSELIANNRTELKLWSNDVQSVASGITANSYTVTGAIAAIGHALFVINPVITQTISFLGALVVAMKEFRSVGSIAQAVVGDIKAPVVDIPEALGGASKGTPRILGVGGGGGGKGGGGADPNAERIRVLEQQEKEAERIYRQEVDAAERSYKQLQTSTEEHTQAIIAAEQKRFEAKRDTVNKELALAKKQSDIEKFQEELRRAEDEKSRAVQEIRDEANQKEIDSLRKHQENLLKLGEQFDERQITAIRERAERSGLTIERGGITFEQAEQAILEIQTDAFNRRLQMLADLEAAYANNAEKFKEVNDEIARVTEEQVRTQEEAARRIDDARDRDIKRNLDLLETLDDVDEEIKRQQIERQRLSVDQQEREGAATQFIIDERVRLDLEEIELDRKRAGRQIDASEEEVLLTAATEQEKETIREHYRQLRDENDRLHDQQRQGVKQVGAAATQANSPFGSLAESLGLDTGLAESAAAKAKIVSDAWVKSGALVGGALRNMAQGFGNLLEQWVLTGEIGPNAVRKMTAAVLAGLAAQAAVEALMELARGFAALANPFTAWQAPFHFKAAAIFGAVAAVAAVTGRAIAGDAFQQKVTGGASGGTSGGGSTGTAYEQKIAPTIREERGQSAAAFGRPQEVHHYHHVQLGLDEKGVLKVISDDYEFDGGTRTLFLKAAAQVS